MIMKKNFFPSNTGDSYLGFRFISLVLWASDILVNATSCII